MWIWANKDFFERSSHRVRCVKGTVCDRDYGDCLNDYGGNRYPRGLCAVRGCRAILGVGKVGILLTPKG